MATRQPGAGPAVGKKPARRKRFGQSRTALLASTTARPGCYSLVISLKRKQTLRVGKLGVARFPKGSYIYTGSALGGLGARLARHLRRDKKIHWHIDYLLKLSQARIEKIILYRPARRQECRQNQRIAALLGATIVLRRFGASDCKSGCESHLYFFVDSRA